MLFGLLNQRFDPDFNDLEINDINMSGVEFQFSVPGNGSKKWGGRSPVPKIINVHNENYKLGPTGFYKKKITAQIWGFSAFLGEGFGRPYGDLNAVWEITSIPEHYLGAKKPDELQTFLTQFYHHHYEEHPKGRNKVARQENLGCTDEELGWQLVHLPKDYKIQTINNHKWLKYSIWGVRPAKTSWYYVLPISERHFISVRFTFDTTNDLKGKIEAQQKQAAEKIASYMKVTFPDNRNKK